MIKDKIMEKIQPTADFIVARLTPDWGSRISLLFRGTEPYEHYNDESGEEIPYGAIVSWTDVELPPESPESEDERIRKRLIYFIQNWKEKAKDFTSRPAMWTSDEKECDAFLAYLEKQKEPADGDFARGYDCGYECCLHSHGAEWFEKQKYLHFDYPGLYFYDGEKLHFQGNPGIEEKQKEQKGQNPVTIVRIPKFRVGDIIQHVPLEKWDRTKKITSIDEHGYNYNLSHLGDTVSGGAIGFAFENEYELVEQKPKFYPGDVIKCTSTGSLCVRCKDGDNIRGDGHTACIGGGYGLASEEEAVQFFQELNENGYQWDCIKGRPML